MQHTRKSRLLASILALLCIVSILPAASTIDSALVVRGTITAQSIDYPAESITNADISTTAAIAATKIVHQYAPTYGQTGTMVAATIPIHVGYGDGTIVAARAVSVTACAGNAVGTIDFKKNGSTVLSAPFVLDSSNTAYTLESGTVSVGTFSAGDVLTAVVAVDAGTGTLGTGLGVSLVLREDSAP